MNIHELVLRLKQLISLHNDIQEVDVGSEYDNDVGGKYEYPMCFIECQPAQLSGQTYSLALLFLDKHIDEDKYDILRAQSVTELILKQTLDYFDYASLDDVFIKASGPALSVSYATDTIAAGWRVEIEVTVNTERCTWVGAFTPPTRDDD